MERGVKSADFLSSVKTTLLFALNVNLLSLRAVPTLPCPRIKM